jgi:hypothetical protein
MSGGEGSRLDSVTTKRAVADLDVGRNDRVGCRPAELEPQTLPMLTPMIQTVPIAGTAGQDDSHLAEAADLTPRDTVVRQSGRD